MNGGRRHEAPRIWFRSERMFLSDGKWYFHTREGVDVGPYDSQFEAEIEAGMLKELLRNRCGSHCCDSIAPLSVIREFVLDSYAMGRPLLPGFSETG
jgi:hypothetical protein